MRWVADFNRFGERVEQDDLAGSGRFQVLQAVVHLVVLVPVLHASWWL